MRTSITVAYPTNISDTIEYKLYMLSIALQDLNRDLSRIEAGTPVINVRLDKIDEVLSTVKGFIDSMDTDNEKISELEERCNRLETMVESLVENLGVR